MRTPSQMDNDPLPQPDRHQDPLNAVFAGALSGVLAYIVSGHALAYTIAFAMPAGWSANLWDALVVYGLGVWLVALLVHLTLLRVFAARAWVAMMTFALTLALGLLATQQLTTAWKALCAWLLGALVATLIQRWLAAGLAQPEEPSQGTA